MVAACYGIAANTSSILTSISLGTGIAVVARSCVIGVSAARGSIAAIIGAWVAVVAVLIAATYA
jgi:hypothetical protein